MDFKTTEYSDLIKKATEILPKGAFLTTKDNEIVNTMTIGWGAFGFQWGMPVATVMVRESRYSKIAMDKGCDFTLTFPLDESMKSALGYCGQKSGRDTDKISDCGLKLIPSKEVSAPVIDCQSIAMECKIFAHTAMDKDSTSTEILDKWYQSGDLHTMYYAKIVDCYVIN